MRTIRSSYSISFESLRATLAVKNLTTGFGPQIYLPGYGVWAIKGTGFELLFGKNLEDYSIYRVYRALSHKCLRGLSLRSYVVWATINTGFEPLMLRYLSHIKSSFSVVWATVCYSNSLKALSNLSSNSCIINLIKLNNKAVGDDASFFEGRAL